MSNEVLSDITVAMNDAWWKIPRRTRNRIMLQERSKYSRRYRGLPLFYSRASVNMGCRKGWIYNDPRYVEICAWQPPKGSHDIPVADEPVTAK